MTLGLSLQLLNFKIRHFTRDWIIAFTIPSKDAESAIVRMFFVMLAHFPPSLDRCSDSRRRHVRSLIGGSQLSHGLSRVSPIRGRPRLELGAPILSFTISGPRPAGPTPLSIVGPLITFFALSISATLAASSLAEGLVGL
jgi:hypothetical protein